MTTTTEIGIRARGLRAGYGGGVILDGVDVDIPKGAVTTVIGPCLLYTSDAADE